MKKTEVLATLLHTAITHPEIGLDPQKIALLLAGEVCVMPSAITVKESA